MLGKLIKHEFRALSRFLLPIHILLLVACLIGRFMFQAMATMDPAKCDIDCLICIPDLHLDRCTMCDIYFNCSTLL